MRLGETIVRCEPFAHAVHGDFRQRVCDFCLNNNNSLRRCGGCRRVLYCDSKCQRTAWKECHRQECAFMKEGGGFRLATARLMARIIIKQRAGKGNVAATLPNGAHRGLDDLLSHAKEIEQDNEALEMFTIAYEDLQRCFKETAPPREEALELFGRCRVNSFGISDDDNVTIAVGLYLEASVFDHSCRPNALVSFTGKTLSVRCIVDDPDLSFEDVRVSYTDLMCDTATRRASLRQTYYFECSCAECESDPGGWERLKQNAMRCPGCKGAVHADQHADQLKCPKCSESLDVKAFRALKAKVIEDVIDRKRDLSKSEFDAMTVRYAEDMSKAMFHPYDKVYFSVLEKACTVHVFNKDWQSLLRNLNEAIVAYKGLHPKYNKYTALLLRRAGVLAMDQREFQKAKALLLESRAILAVTHGEDHPVFSKLLQLLSTVQANDNEQG